jgi:Notch-like protein
MFTQEFYNATIDEGAPIGTSVLQVFANDQDSQMHSLLEFSVTDTTDFRVDATGTLYTNTGLDQETVPSYQFVVSVRNPGDIAADTADIFITIIDINDHPPSISLSPDSATLQEPQTRISLSYSLTITDLDANPSLDYGIVEILEDAPGVLIATISLPGITVTGDGSRVIIFSGASQSLNNYEQVLQGVMYEDTAEEPLPITREIAYQVGSDSGLVVALNYTSSETTSNVTTFQVLVELINDQTPEIQLDTRTSASLMLPECTETGSYSTTFTEGGNPVHLSDDSLTITDADSGDTTLHWATVELVHTTNEELLQTLHYSGDVLVNTSASSNTRLVLQGPASLAEFEAALHAVTYQSLSQEPMGITQATFTVNDGKFTSSPVLTCVQLFEVNDPPVLTLGAAEGSVDVMLMYNEGQTDGLLLAEHLQIIDEDSVYLSSALVVLQGATAEEMLEVTNHLDLIVIPISSSGIKGLQISASNDETTIETFETVLRSITYTNTRLIPLQEPREITFVVTDNEIEPQSSAEAVATVLFRSIDNPPILDLNGPSQAGRNYTITYTEGSPAIRVFPNATITDVDSSTVSSLQISVIDEPAGSDIILPTVAGLTMNSTTTDSLGRVITYSGEQPVATYLNALLFVDYRSTEDEPMPNSVTLHVQVFTLNELSGTPLASNVAWVTIDIIPFNDNDPVFSETSYSGAVYENMPGGSAVVTVLASDGDIFSGSNITYEIAGEIGEFIIDATSGSVSTTRPLDSEFTSSYQLMVIASDNDGVSPRSSTVPVTISVLDVNDNPPVFSGTLFFASITENANSGQSVLTVTATDNDITTENNDITYELHIAPNGGSGSGDLTPLPPEQLTPLPFSIDSSTGEVRVAEHAVIDYEDMTEFSLLVVARDSGIPPLSASAEVTISVLDENDEEPQFTQSLYTGSVAEDAVLGTLILTISATDIDSASISYTIEDSEFLDIDSATGEVTLNRVVDFSVTPFLTATVFANDMGLPPLIGQANLRIEVLNINNNAPIFSEESYSFTVTEGTVLEGQVSATDADGDSITFLPLEGFGHTFTLNMTSGLITTSPDTELDYETQSIYILRAAATDGTFTTPVNITVQVEDANDNAPYFTSAGYSATVSESSSPGSVIVQVEAEDRDSGSNAIIVYSILDGDMFTIGNDTGIIRLEQPVDFEADSGPFVIVVVAENTEPPFWSNTVVITVVVSDANDNHPILSLSTLNYSYVENSPPISIAPGLTVMDGDTHIHLLSRCEVTLERGLCQISSSELSNACGSSNTDCEALCAEEIAVDISLASPGGVQLATAIETTSQTLTLSGNASEAEYQAVLSSLTYINLVAEPSPGTRSVSIQCHDAQLPSNILLLSVDVILINDNPILIEAEPQRVSFVEGDTTLPVGEAVGLRLIDLDINSYVVGVVVSLENPQDILRERLSVNPESVNGREVESGLEITINDTSSLQNYQVLLGTLTYTYSLPEYEEPERGERLVRITVSDGTSQSSIIITIDVEILNDSPPEIRFAGSSNVSFTEGSTVPLPLGSVLMAVISDADNNDVFLMESASVQLFQGAVDGLDEVIDYDRNTVNALGISVDETSHVLVFHGRANVSAYQQALSTVTYINRASEPVPATRVITYRVFDGIHGSNIARANLTLSLINDNILRLQCGLENLTFIEESPQPILVASELTLVDLDEDHIITGVSVDIAVPQQGDELDLDHSVTPRLHISTLSPTSIRISGMASDDYYQRLLRTLTYRNTDEEPFPGPRSLIITTTSVTETQACSISITVLLRNDNRPGIDLSGPSSPSINYSTSLNYSIFTANRAVVSADDVSISDEDRGGVIVAVEVTLVSGHEQDRLVLSEEVCPANQETICHLRYKLAQESGNTVCVCGSSHTAPAADKATLTVSRNSTSILVQQSGSQYTESTFEELIHSIFFTYDPTSPQADLQSYRAMIKVTVSDGDFTNQPPAFTTVLVNVMNEAPRVLLDGQSTSAEVVMADGSPSITLSSSPVILEDSSLLTRVTITLTNPQDSTSFESLSLSASYPLPDQITLNVSDGGTIELTGTASTDMYTSALSAVYYTYTKMDGIIENQPDFTPRVISVEATDGDGAQGISTLTISFDRSCVVFSNPTRLTLATQADVERMAVCTSVRGVRIDIVEDYSGNDPIVSLLPLRDISAIGDLSISGLSQLTDLSGLENLAQYGDELSIVNNLQLATTAQLSANVSTEPSNLISLNNIGVRSNPLLGDLDGFRLVENVTGLLYIQNGDSLTEFSGFDNLVHVDTLVLAVLGDKMTTIDDFSSLFSASRIYITRNSKLEVISGFQRLRYLEGLLITENPNLVALDGLWGVDTVTSVVNIVNNPQLCYVLDSLSDKPFWQGRTAESASVTVDPEPTVDKCQERTCAYPSPCLNDAVCNNMTSPDLTANKYSCACLDNYFGIGCQNFDACSTACQNGGNCTVDLLNVRQFVCSCPSGTTGFSCETILSPCASSPCENGGVCSNGDDTSGEFDCLCLPGFSGAVCEIDVDDCATSPCQNGGSCVDGVNSYTCQCPSGFSGVQCESEVIFCTLDSCANGGSCVEGVDSSLCVCQPGWTGPDCHENINECENEVCQNRATCIDRLGSFTCLCPVGFTGSTCSDNTDFCAGNPCNGNGNCSSGSSEFTCLCDRGYTGELCDENIDDCALTPCNNGGTCVDGITHFTCVCSAGFTGLLCELNIDDCASELCQNGGTCIDDVAGVECVCRAGFSGPFCETQIDFCIDSPCSSNGECRTTDSGFECDCPEGWSGSQCQFVNSVSTKLASCGIEGATDVFSESSVAFTPESLPTETLYSLTSKMLYFSTWVWQEEGTSGTVFSLTSSATSDVHIGLVSNTEFNEVTLHYSSPGMGELELSITNTPLTAGQWHHVSATLSNTTFSLAIDNQIMFDRTVSHLVIPASINFTVGGGGTRDQFTGIMRGAAIYDGVVDLSLVEGCLVSCVGSEGHCQNDGTCLDQFTQQYLCSCTFAYTGPFCQYQNQRISFERGGSATLFGAQEPLSDIELEFKSGGAQGQILLTLPKPSPHLLV